MSTSKNIVCDDCGLYSTLSPVEPEEIVNAARSILSRELEKNGEIYSSSFKVSDLMYAELAQEKREVFAVLYLDAQHRKISFEKEFYGTIDQCPVFPRMIAKRCLELDAAAVIVSHNHPSGLAQPSLQDEHLTRLIIECLAIIDVRCLDHIIVGDTCTFSFGERGLM